MPQSDDLSRVLERIANGEQTEADLQALQDWLNQRDITSAVLQFGKYSVNIQQALGDVHVGDRLELTEENIRAIAQAIQSEIGKSGLSQPAEMASVDELVQQVRSRLHDDIQRLHGTMPLWGIDHWVPLGELFVDVNILEELSNSHRAELEDLWQDFSQNPGYRSLDRIGLGRKKQRVSGLEVLEKNTNLMVVGKPGSGKTTYLQRIVTECNVGNLQAHRIPVLIKLREFVDDGRTFSYSLEQYLEQYWKLSTAETQLVLSQGRSLILLDGLDEVTGKDGKNIAKEIKRFARGYSQVQVIVTCRTQSQESRFERFDYVEVADFNEPQVRAFAEHWFKTVCGDVTVGQTKVTTFLGQLFREENKPIRELAITPILLSLTCAVFQQTGKFYSKRSKLYEEGLELLLEQWDKSREIERDEIYRDLSLERKLELLRYLAVKRFEQEQYVLFDQAEIEGYIAEFLQIRQRDSRGVLRAIEFQHGLLIKRTQEIWSFSHLTFQEFLAAQYFASQNRRDQILDNIFKSYWQEIFTLVFYITEDSENSNEFLLRLKEKINEREIEDNEIKMFFNWISQKTKSLNTSYRPEVVRLFYCLNVFDCLYKIDGHERAILESLKRLATELNLDLDQIQFDLMCSNDQSGEYDLFLDRSLVMMHKIASNILYEVSDRDALVSYLHEILKGTIKLRELSRLSNKHEGSDIHIKDELKYLKKKFPEVRDDFFQEWISSNDYKKWIERLKKLMNCRSIGHEWQFSKKQFCWLSQYFCAELILVTCLNSSTCINEKIYEEVISNFLLPL